MLASAAPFGLWQSPIRDPLQMKENAMARAMRPWLAAASLMAACLVSGGPARANEAHADGTATTQAAACKLALMLARVDVGKGKVTASHCDCLENKEDFQAPWSCQAFMTYR